MKLPTMPTLLAMPVKSSDVLTLGGTPRVHLLPKEVEEQRKARSIRRLLLAALAGVVALVIIGVGIATLGLSSATSDQTTEQTQSAALAGQINKYASVTTIQNAVNDVKNVEPVAVKGEILWTPFIASLQSTLPAGTSITQFTAKLDPTIAVATGGASNPLINTHVATLSVTAVGSQASISAWLGNLSSLKGVTNVSPGAISLTPSGQYTADVDLLLNSDVVAQRFAEGTK